MKSRLRIPGPLDRACPLSRTAILLPLLVLALFSQPVFALSATWKVNPTSDAWLTATNWTPATVPNGPADIATFATSNVTDVTVTEDIEVSSIIFNPGTTPFDIQIGGMSGISGFRTLTISGAGIINNSGVRQKFVDLAVSAAGMILLTNSASAGDRTTFTNNGVSFFTGGSGLMEFQDNSTAATCTIFNNGATQGGFSGMTYFFGSSSAADSTIINTPAFLAVVKQDFLTIPPPARRISSSMVERRLVMAMPRPTLLATLRLEPVLSQPREVFQAPAVTLWLPLMKIQPLLTQRSLPKAVTTAASAAPYSFVKTAPAVEHELYFLVMQCST